MASSGNNNNKATKRRRVNNGTSNKNAGGGGGSFNMIPTNMYPRIVQYMTGNQIAKLASASPNFFRWVRNKPQYLARMSIARRNKLFATRLLPGNYANSLWEFLGYGKKKYLTPEEYQFIEHKANYSKYRGNAYNRQIYNPMGYALTPVKNSSSHIVHPTHYTLMKHLIGMRPPPWSNKPHMRQFVTPSLQNTWTPRIVQNAFGMVNLEPQMRADPRYALKSIITYDPTIYNTNKKTGLPTSTARKIARERQGGGTTTRNRIYAESYRPQFRAALQRARQRIANKRRGNNNRRN